jgi:Holliday junction resolvasome RuvABC endonuclease subunit
MISWGVDLGVRSLYVARIDDSGLTLYSHDSLKIHKQDRSAELQALSHWIQPLYLMGGLGLVYAEEPPLAGARNLQTFLHLSQVSGVVACSVPTTLVPVSSWKKGTVGDGAASKDLVAGWLLRRHPAYSEACRGDQNLVDATCIALYGEKMGQR